MKKYTVCMLAFFLFTSPCAPVKALGTQDALPYAIGITTGLVADGVGLFLWQQANTSFLKDSYQISRGVFGGLTVGATMLIGAKIASYITKKNITELNYHKRAQLVQKAWDVSISSSCTGMLALLGHRLCVDLGLGATSCAQAKTLA